MSRLNLQQGYILLPVVILLTLVATSAFMLDYESALDSGVTASNLEVRQAELVAQAGLAHAAWAVQNSGCIGDITMTTVPFGKNSYTATIDAAATSTSSYQLSPDRDAFVRENNPDTNFGTDTGILAGLQRRGLLQFDLASIAAGSRVVSATLWLYVSTNDPVDVVNIHPVTETWTEADATWNTIASSFDPEVYGVIAPQPAANAWVAVNLTPLAQAWVNDPAANHGIMLIAESVTIDSKFSSREHSTPAQHPYLQVTTAIGDVSPVQVTATGTLASRPGPAGDISRTLERTRLAAYQPPQSLVLQPDAAAGKDVWFAASKPTWNYGAHDTLPPKENAGQRALIEFNLDALPVGAFVISAEIQLYATRVQTPGTIRLHRLSRSWVEGSCQGSGCTADGATWDTRDGINPWNTPGTDFDSAAAAELTVAAQDAWHSWDITSLARAWVRGELPNHGLVLIGPAPGNIDFAGSDHATAAWRPKLVIDYACECGSPCAAPRGSGNVLMVVVNSTTLVERDARKKALFESWGYTVSVIDESDTPPNYDAALATADVVFISETVNQNDVGNILDGVSVGVVSQDGIYNDDLRIASGNAFTVASAINLTDTSHYITRVFPPGPLEIYRGAMEQLTVSGSTAPGLQTLADTAGAGSLVVLDNGAIGTGGVPVPGRRVMLPLGRDARFNWDYLNANGRLLLYRALQWGMGADLATLPPKQLLFVSGGSLVIEQPSGDTVVTPTALEQLRIDLIESWGYKVTLIHASQSQLDFDAALGGIDVAYVSSDVTEAALGTRLKDAAVGVVNEQGDLVDEFGFGLQSVGNKLRNEIDVLDNTHYITEPFLTGLLTIVSTDQTLHFMTSGEAGGFARLAQVFNTGSLWDDALGVIETGGELYGGGSAAARRVLLPWGDASFDVSALNADGQTLMQRAIEWAAGAGEPPSATLWLATLDDVSASGAPGLADWADGEILLFSEPNLALEPAVTNGTFSSIVNLDGFASDGNAEIHGLHYVEGAITVGGANSVALQPGDVLITTAGNEILTSNNSISVNNEDVFVFRPVSDGDYSAGDFIFLLDGSQIHSETDTVAVSLVEKDTAVGDGTLTAGTILYATTNRRDVLAFKADDVGAGTTAGTVTTIVEGLDVDLGSEIRGLDLAEDTVMVGGHVIPSGSILLTLDADGSTAGNNVIATDSEDILYLTMTKIGSTSQGNATLLFDGSDVGLDTTSEHLQALSLSGSVTGGGGGGGEPPQTCDATFADDFETDDYSGSTGSLAWATDWLEVNESDGPGGGDEQVVNQAGGLAGRLKDNGPGNSGEGLERGADLSGYATATLTYAYWRNLGNGDSVAVRVSNDGGANWVQLDLYAGPASDADANPQTASYDLTPYISLDTRIRFLTGTSNGNNDGMYIDDVEICVTN